jgi:31-O-methyltransferase
MNPVTQHASALTTLPTGASIEEVSRHETRLLVDEIFKRQVYSLPDLSGVEVPVIIDIGSNIGVFVHYAKSMYPCARVFCVEPVPPVAAILRSNVTCFGESVKVIETGVGATSGSMEVTFYPGYSIMSRLNADHMTDVDLLSQCIREDLRTKLKQAAGLNERVVTAALGQKLEGAQTFPCQITTLPDLMEMNGITEIHFLKMDIEGSEGPVLRSLTDAQWSKIQNIALEVHEYEKDSEIHVELENLLNSKGFFTRLDHATAPKSPRTLMLYGHSCMSV